MTKERPQPAELEPIVQSMSGKFSFLYRRSGHLTTDGSIAPFPDADSIRRALQGARVLGGKDRYARGRAANSLAAVHLCNGELPEAFEAIKESEATFVEMFNDPTMYGLEDWVLPGMAAAQYNACLILYRAGDVGQNYEFAQKNREAAIQSLADMRHRDEKWEFLDRALKALQPEQTSDQHSGGGLGPADASDKPATLAHVEPWNIRSEDTKSIVFPATDPPNTLVLLHANLIDDFIAVEVGKELVAVLPTGARKQIETAANFLESDSLAGWFTFEIPAVADARTGAVTVWCNHIFNSIALRDERNRPFAGFGMSEEQGSRLLRSLLV